MKCGCWDDEVGLRVRGAAHRVETEVLISVPRTREGQYVCAHALCLARLPNEKGKGGRCVQGVSGQDPGVHTKRSEDACRKACMFRSKMVYSGSKQEEVNIEWNGW